MKARHLSALSFVPLLLLGCSGGDFGVAGGSLPEDAPAAEVASDDGMASDDVRPETKGEDALAVDAEQDASVDVESETETETEAEAETEADAVVDADADGVVDGDADADAVVDAVVDATDACAKNACGGCAILAAAPGSACGKCSTGKVVCDGANTTRCDDPVSGPAPGATCGTCGTKKYVCDATAPGGTRCSADDANACGGCGTLSPALGTACGACGSGTYVCDPITKKTKCDDPVPEGSPKPGAACGTCKTLAYACSADKKSVSCPGDDKNGCGGCSALAHQPGTKCGACGSGTFTCSGTNATVCTDPVTNPPGSKCGICSTSSYVCSGATTVCTKTDDRTSARDVLYGISSGPQAYVNQSSPGYTYRYALAFKTDRTGSIAGFFVGLYQYDHVTSAADTGVHFRLILGTPTVTPAPANVLADVTVPGTDVSPVAPYGANVTLPTPTASYPAGTAFYVEIENSSPRYNYQVAGASVATPSKTDWYYAGPSDTSYTQDTKFDPYFAVDMKGCY